MSVNPEIEFLVEKHYLYLVKFCNKKCRNSFLSEDIAQETMIKFILGYDKIKDKDAIKTWLCATALNEIRHHYNKSKREHVILNKYFEHKNLIPKYYKPHLNIMIDLEYCVNSLAIGYRNIFHSRYIEDKNLSEIAAENGITIGACKSQHFKLRNKIFNYFGDSFGLLYA